MGTPEDALILGLSRDGFQRAFRDVGADRYAYLEWSAFPCAMRAQVFWRVDAQRRITNLRGKYHEAGCL